MKYLFGYIGSNINSKDIKKNYENKVILDKKLSKTDIFASSNCQKTLLIKLDNKIYLFYGTIKNFDVKNSLDLKNFLKGVSDKIFLSSLDGKFVACIFDINKQKLYIKTDNFGQVPIYFYIKNSKFIFSTDFKYIFDTGIKKEVDKIKVAEYLQFMHYSTNRTYFKEINKLSSKELVILDFSNKYKILRNIYKIENKSKTNDGSEVYSYLKKSFDNNNIKPKGIFLSGGIDSSSVLSIIDQFYPDQKINSYSFIFPFKTKSLETKSCEKVRINELTKSFRTKHLELDGTKKNPFHYIDLTLSLTNTPSFFTNMYIFIDILETAKIDNIDILYSGVGGDTVISWGYESIRENFVKLKFIKFSKQIYQLSKTRNLKISLIIKRILYQELLLEKLKNINIKILEFFGIVAGVKDFIQKDLVVRSNLVKKISFNMPLNAKKYHQYIVNAPDHELNNEILYHIFNFYDVSHVAPFYDLELAKYCIAVNHEKKILNGIERSYFREALQGFIPDLIRENQTKANIGISFLLNFVHYGKDIVSKQLFNPHPYLKRYVKLKLIHKKFYIFDLEDEKQILKNTDQILDLYLVYVLNKWLRLNF